MCRPLPSAWLTLALALPAFFASPALADPRPETEPLPGAEEIARSVRTAPGRLPQLAYKPVDGKAPLPLPLRETRVFAELVGLVAQVDVVQTYENPSDRPIEAIYTFPLPENAAVDDMTIRIGERVIRAEIRKREEAKAEYEAAKQAGHTAALLEQERPNIFTQSVANIAPGEAIEVSIRYVQHLTHDMGRYEWVFPMVVGPRFIPGAPTGKAGSGWAPDTDEVTDASRITPPILGAGRRSGHDIDVEVVIDAGFAIEDVAVPTHETEMASSADGSVQVRLSRADRIPNRDFVLRYRVDGPKTRAASFAAPGPDGGVVSVLVQPPRLDAKPAPREVVFVVDISGSMYGAPLAQSKAAMRRALNGIGPDDSFNVYTFAGATAQAFKTLRPGNSENVEAALRFIEAAQAGGGTMLADAVDAALSPPVEAGRDRFVVFLTDGYVGNEDAIFASAERLVATQKESGRRARVFGFGVGSSVNRHLIDGLGKAGDGAGLYVTLAETPDAAVDHFWRMVDRPIMTDVRVEWGGLDVHDVEPSTMPDLLASRPLVVLARYGTAGSGTATVRGKVGGQEVAIPVAVTLPAKGAAGVRGGALPSLWARARVETLSRRLWQGPDAEAVAAITELGLRYRIVTAYTSFVAVDRSRVVGDGKPTTVVQPVEAPLGVDPTMAAPPEASAMGYGGLGMVGTGAGGGGYGMGAAGVSRRARMGSAPPPARMRRPTRPSGDVDDMLGGLSAREAAPTVRVGSATVQGSLDRAIIQRVVRRHNAQVRYCYEKALNKNPALKGKVVLKWTIDAEGKVAAVSVSESTLKDAETEACLTQTVKRWQFPKPAGGGVVVVNYPFNFSPG
ncbi:MAG: TonB family protein [Myxococcales bacterium]|nr:TonB family protein [Myxococcales bacterium]